MTDDQEKTSRIRRLKEHWYGVAGIRTPGLQEAVLLELEIAVSAYPAMASAHEGESILREELVELQVEVFKKHGQRDVSAMRKEAIQVAAMALRFVMDVCDSGRGQR